MRKFKCFDCQHEWQLPHGEGGRGTDLSCPKCGSQNIHRVDKQQGRGQNRRARPQSTE